MAPKQEMKDLKKNLKNSFVFDEDFQVLDNYLLEDSNLCYMQ